MHMKQKHALVLTKNQISRLADVFEEKIYYAGMNARKIDIKIMDKLNELESFIENAKEQ